MVYKILEENMPRLEKKIVRIEAKCRKYGNEFSYKQIGEEYRSVKLNNGKEVNLKYICVDVEGTAQMADWRFIASIDCTEKGNIFSKAAGTDIEIPERYYNAHPVCEHCGNHNVKHTFIVQNTVTGEFKQVGRSCLSDFTHGLSTEAVAQYISLYDTLIKGEAVNGMGGYTEYINTKEYLLYCAECIRAYGFHRSQDENPTSGKAIDFYGNEHGWHSFMQAYQESIRKEMDKMGIDIARPETVQAVDSALSWIADQEEKNDYMHNLKCAASLEYICSSHYGLLASLLPACNKDLERQAELDAKKKAEAASEFVGNVGERITVAVDQWRCLTSWDTQYGISYMYQLISTEGNVFIWITQKCLEEVHSIIGTVKEHKEFNNRHETVITRCKVA